MKRKTLWATMSTRQPYQGCGGDFVAQKVFFTNNNSPSTALINGSFPKDNVAGNTLILTIRQVNNVNQTGGSYSVFDSQGNVWVQAPGTWVDNTNQGTWISVFYCTNCKGGPNTVSVDWGLGNAFLRVIAAEFSGQLHYDQNSHAQASSVGNAFDSGSITTTKHSLFIGIMENATINCNYTPNSSRWSLVDFTDGNLAMYFRFESSGTFKFNGSISANVQWEATLYTFN